jgi:hypothetical protein
MSAPPTTAAEDRLSEPRALARLWFGLLGGAVAWKLQLVVNYAVVPYACWHRVEILNHAASLATFLLALGAVWVAWGSWKALGEEWGTEMGGPIGRSRFMALSGLALSAMFALMILGQWIPNLLLSPCDGIS